MGWGRCQLGNEGLGGLRMFVGDSRSGWRDSNSKCRSLRAGDQRNAPICEEWDGVVANSVMRGLAGFECLSGIPGRVGATPIQNVGAYGQETSETLTAVEALDLEWGAIVKLSASDCEFGYRTSRFKTRDRDSFIITRVTRSGEKQA